MKKNSPSRPHAEWLREQLKDQDFAAEFISAASDDAHEVYLSALRQVAEARGMAMVAKSAGIPRESLYRALSPKGNPRLATLLAIMGAIGMKLTAHPIAKKRATKQRAAA